MKYGDIYILPEIIDAQRKNELVIFAGAGVSYAPLTKAASFEDTLIETWRNHSFKGQLPANRIKVPIPPEDLFDYYRNLEKLCGISVRQFIGEVYEKYKTPSILHQLLVRLFTKDQSLRIVTTNFDTLFTIACQLFRDETPTEINYPNLSSWEEGRSVESAVLQGVRMKAKPNRRLEINAIAHLHGSAKHDVGKIIITNEDFRAAYFGKDNVAYKFLSELLETSCVLFIGYSLNDPLVGQVIGARSNNSRKFTICPKQDGIKWHNVGVDAMVYQKRDGDDDKAHEGLYEALRLWAEDIQGSNIVWNKKYEIIDSPKETLPESSQESE